MPKQALSDILGWRHSTLKRGFKGKSGPSGTAGSSHQVLETVVVRDLQGVQLALHFPFPDERLGVA